MLSGKDIDESLHESIKEHLLASEYGWSLEYIRSLDIRDMKIHTMVCLMKKKIEQKQMESFAGLNAIRRMV